MSRQRRKRGSGTVVKIGKAYHARRTLNGIQEYGPARPTADQAEADRLAWAKSPAPPRASVPYLADWLLTYRDEYAVRLADSTFNTYESFRIRHVMTSPIAQRRLTDLDLRQLQAWTDGLRRYELDPGTGEFHAQGPLSGASVRRVASYLHKALSVAQRRGLISSHPMTGVVFPKIDRRPKRVLAPEEAAKLLVIGDRTDCIIVVAMLTGMRRSEIAALEWGHVGDGVLQVPGTKSERSRGSVPLPDLAAKAIAAQPKRSRFVFSTESGRPVLAWNISRDVKARLAARGIPPEVRLHDLRGTFVSLLIEFGADIAVVRDLARHSKATTTLEDYAQSRGPVRAAAVDRLVEAIQRADGTDKVS